MATNCLLTPDVNRFTQMYSGMLGLVDSVSVPGMRDASLSPLALGTPQPARNRHGWIRVLRQRHLAAEAQLHAGPRPELESGYVLRIGRQLPQAWVLSSVPYFHRDAASGQTLAMAYDAIAQQLRSGVPAGSVTPQPWFENLLGPGQTVQMAGLQATSFIDGNLSGLWLQINNRRVALGLEPLSNRQIQTLWSRGDGGESLHNAFFTTVRRRVSRGLTWSASYTLSRSMDEGGRRQNSIGAQSSGFDAHLDWGPSDFNRTHVFSATGLCDLPFGQNGGALSRLTGGWYVAGIFSVSSGVPLDVCQRTGVFGGGLVFTGCVGAIPTGSADAETTVSRNNAGSGGVGTTGNPETGGTGLNLFDNPEAVFDSYRRVLISQDDRAGRATIRGLPRWNLDLSIGKRTRFTGTIEGLFTAEIVNVFNSLQFNNPGLNLASPASFGVITSQGNTPRQIQLGYGWSSEAWSACPPELGPVSCARRLVGRQFRSDRARTGAGERRSMAES